jgi:mannose-1-phosphate guanylyltransferase
MSKNLSKVWTIIPIGGVGIRLLPYTASTSKALVPLVNMFPITEFILYGLTKELGLRKFIFGLKGIVNYKDVQRYYQGGKGWSSKWGVVPRVDFQYQNPNFQDTGSADCVAYNVRKFLIKSNIIVTPCDNLYEPEDLRRMYNFSLKTKHSIVVGLTTVEDPSCYGVADFAKDGRTIKKFIEKPKGKTKSNLANTGVYIVKPAAFKYLKGDFAHDTLPGLAERGKLAGYTFSSNSWYDTGSPGIFLNTFQKLLHQPHGYFEKFIERVSVKVPGHDVWIRGKGSYSIDVTKQIKKSILNGEIRVKGPVLIGRDCLIGNNVTLSSCSIGDLSVIDSNSEIEASNVLDAWVIGRDSVVKDSLLGRCGTMGDFCKIENSFLGGSNTIGSNIQLKGRTLDENEEVLK